MREVIYNTRLDILPPLPNAIEANNQVLPQIILPNNILIFPQIIQIPPIQGVNPTRIGLIANLIFELEKILLVLMMIWCLVDVYYAWQLHLILVTMLGLYIQPIIYSNCYIITFVIIPFLNHYHASDRSISSLIGLGLVCGLQYLLIRKVK